MRRARRFHGHAPGPGHPDLLTDREGPTLTAWLVTHPGVEIVSWARSTTYAEAIRQGAPHALQVADRWQVLKNLGEAVEAFLTNKKAALKAAWKSGPDPPPTCLPPPPARTGRTQQAVATSLARNTRLIDLYHHIQALAATQVRVTDIAEQLPICRPTVYRYVQMEHPPELLSPQDRRSRTSARAKRGAMRAWTSARTSAQPLSGSTSDPVLSHSFTPHLLLPMYWRQPSTYCG